MTVYLDHAATTKIMPAARDAMLDAMEQDYGNPSSLHALGQQASRRLGEARESIAQLLDASPGELYFTSGGSEGDNQAILYRNDRSRAGEAAHCFHRHGASCGAAYHGKAGAAGL